MRMRVMRATSVISVRESVSLRGWIMLMIDTGNAGFGVDGYAGVEKNEMENENPDESAGEKVRESVDDVERKGVGGLGMNGSEVLVLIQTQGWGRGRRRCR